MLFMNTEGSKRCEEFCVDVAPFDFVYRGLARFSVGLGGKRLPEGVKGALRP